MDSYFNRRRFLQLTAAVPLAGSISALLSSTAFAIEGGEIVLGKDAELVRMDVHKDTDTGTSWPIFGLVYDTLVGVDAAFNPVPSIAESWTQPTPTTYVFQMRKDATFSNGRLVNPDDVKGSLERVINPDTGSLWKAQIGPIKSVTVTGESEVTVELNAPYVPFLIALAGVGAAIIPMQELNDGSFDPATTMLGSGPFIVEEHVQDQYWLFARNPHYWGDGPIVEHFRMNIIKDDAARVAALRDGRADIAIFYRPDAPELLRAVPNVEVVLQQTTNYYRIDFNSIWEGSPFRDGRLRQAVNIAIDRQQIADIALAGASVVDYPVPVAFPSAKGCRDIASYGRDLERARALVKEAGADGMTVDLIASPDEYALPFIAQVIQTNLAEIGLKVNILQLPRPQWMDVQFAKAQFQFALSYNVGYGDPSMVIQWWNPQFARWNEQFVPYNEQLAQWLSQSGQTPPGPERDKLFDSICAAIDEDAYMIALASKNDTIAYRKDRIKANIQAAEGYASNVRHAAEFERIS
jgi:peptide/nickel transport system substrate-binding protein